jgi:hypothetical protein
MKLMEPFSMAKEKFLEKVASVKLEALISKFKVHAVEPTQ